MDSCYKGKLLEINLTKGSHNIVELDRDDLRNYIGGKGLGAKLLYDWLEKGTDPLSPDNLLIFLTGPLTDTKAPTSGRGTIVTKSPATGLFNDSHFGGFLATEIKRAGYDGILFKGKAEHPVMVHVRDKDITIEDASHLWGKRNHQVFQELTKEKPKLRTATIGPAGENMVKFACVTIDQHRHAGRGGSGAVMGSKNLKALTVKGTGSTGIHDEEHFNEVLAEVRKDLAANEFVPIRRKYGTPIWVKPVNAAGILPTRNFREGEFEHAEDISGEALHERIWTKNGACYNCPIACWNHSRIRQGEYKDTVLVGPEYETIALMGSNCGIASIEEIAKLCSECNDLGMDTISTGVAISFAMECSELGIIPKDLLDIRFGNTDKVIKLMDDIAHRQGIGNMLAEGTKRAAEQLGGDTHKFAIHVKGLEVPGYDPRGVPGMAIAYATSDRGACHQRAWTVKAELNGDLGDRFSKDGRAVFVKDIQDERAAFFSMVLCDFLPISEKNTTALWAHASGFDVSKEDYLQAGERIWNIIRLFNLREVGLTRADDTLPDRLLNQPLPSGEAEGKTVTSEMLDSMLDEYYLSRGWDAQGIPGEEKLTELGLQ